MHGRGAGQAFEKKIRQLMITLHRSLDLFHSDINHVGIAIIRKILKLKKVPSMEMKIFFRTITKFKFKKYLL